MVSSLSPSQTGPCDERCWSWGLHVDAEQYTIASTLDTPEITKVHFAWVTLSTCTCPSHSTMDTFFFTFDSYNIELFRSIAYHVYYKKWSIHVGKCGLAFDGVMSDAILSTVCVCISVCLCVWDGCLILVSLVKVTVLSFQKVNTWWSYYMNMSCSCDGGYISMICCANKVSNLCVFWCMLSIMCHVLLCVRFCSCMEINVNLHLFNELKRNVQSTS